MATGSKKHGRTKNSIILGATPPAAKKATLGSVPSPRKFIFSFRYYKQTDLFGLGGSVDHGWFISFLDKISELSREDYEKLMSDFVKKDIWRIHPIDWSSKNVPLERKDFEWVDKAYLSNDEEYPFFQFQVGTALGRVVGFWDEAGVFNIIVLDRMHNLQPSQYSDYKLRDAPLGSGEFAHAIRLYEDGMKSCVPDCPCRGLYGQVQASLTGRLGKEVVIVGLEKNHYEEAIRLVKDGLIDGVGDLVFQGLEALK